MDKLWEAFTCLPYEFFRYIAVEEIPAIPPIKPRKMKKNKNEAMKKDQDWGCIRAEQKGGGEEESNSNIQLGLRLRLRRRNSAWRLRRRKRKGRWEEEERRRTNPMGGVRPMPLSSCKMDLWRRSGGFLIVWVLLGLWWVAENVILLIALPPSPWRWQKEKKKRRRRRNPAMAMV